MNIENPAYSRTCRFRRMCCTLCTRGRDDLGIFFIRLSNYNNFDFDPKRPEVYNYNFPLSKVTVTEGLKFKKTNKKFV